jgi:hypothetical protein
MGKFAFSDDEMIAFRRFLATNRGAQLPMPSIYGVGHPFGRRATSTYCKIISFEDHGMLNMHGCQTRWSATLKLAESF